MRERLIELLEEIYPKTRYIPMEECKEKTADYLLQNGVVLLPCRCNECSHRCESNNECTLYGRICAENGYCDKAEKALERSKQ